MPFAADGDLRDDGDAQPARDQILDALLIVQPRAHAERGRLQADAAEKGVHTALTAASRLPQKQRLASQKLRDGRAVGRERGKIGGVRRNEHHGIAVEGREGKILLRLLHADERQLELPLPQPVEHVGAVALVDGEGGLRVQAAVLRKQLRQNIGRGNGGAAEADQVLILRPAGQKPVLKRENVGGVFVKLPPARGDGKRFRGAQEQPLMQLVLELADMGADGRLRGVEPRGGLCEAAAVHNGDEGSKLLKVHVRPPGSEGPAPPLRRRCRPPC